MFVYEPNHSRFESSCSHLTFWFRAWFEQGVPWHSDNYRVWIHSETRTWHDKNIQLNKLFFKVYKVFTSIIYKANGELESDLFQEANPGASEEEGTMSEFTIMVKIYCWAYKSFIKFQSKNTQIRQLWKFAFWKIWRCWFQIWQEFFFKFWPESTQTRYFRFKSQSFFTWIFAIPCKLKGVDFQYDNRFFKNAAQKYRKKTNLVSNSKHFCLNETLHFSKFRGPDLKSGCSCFFKFHPKTPKYT